MADGAVVAVVAVGFAGAGLGIGVNLANMHRLGYDWQHKEQQQQPGNERAFGVMFVDSHRKMYALAKVQPFLI